MGVEYEWKYRARPDVLAAVQSGFDLPWQTITMQTTYFDTPDGRLKALRCTLRSRLENGKCICTLKTPGKYGGRGEWELACDDIRRAAPILCKLTGRSDLSFLETAELIPTCGARFTRQAATVTVPGAVAELALDQGFLCGGSRETPLCELEVEFKSGSLEEAARFARELSLKFRLEPERLSKFRRAADLAEGGI